MTRTLPLLAAALLVMALAGCDDPVDLLGQANGYTAAVAFNMQARGWAGFPSDPVSLVRYVADLRESIMEARSGRVALSSLGADVARPLREEPWEPEPLGRAFGVPGGGE